jgi:hypothetical protein
MMATDQGVASMAKIVGIVAFILVMFCVGLVCICAPRLVQRHVVHASRYAKLPSVHTSVKSEFSIAHARLIGVTAVGMSLLVLYASIRSNVFS